MILRRISRAVALLVPLVALAWWLPRQFPAPPAAGPQIQTMPDSVIIGLEIPIHSAQGTSTLKAAYAVPVGEDELKVYGGFVYTTPSRRIEGEEAIIHLRSGRARAMKQIRIWEQ
jgi:hypothetical protein